ncbi:ATP-binding protein [Streptomyces globisporus]|uniref:histidine kinase n=1 Tax=Streptomyces globisporus TaxID=1908 RepID=A0ABN8UTT0_STRGL|nr:MULTISPECIES: ATP-binding protein [Streptomyces]RDL09493.1 signal transduction histidine kinase [Streptomyces sp. HB202]WSF77289.1 ATP-binding protein [Streptomyces globisporus]WSQ92413.1 ATP-binding protein [Streptomyces globisporus]WSV90383.1 ATP-binding protein [Streptomyces globisporus]CAH9413672.1 Putative sensor and ATPase, component of G-protein-coupled receptor (GPCR) system [Streptomyces globisporus]
MRPSHRPTALALLISAAATGTLTLWAVASAPDTVRTPLAWGAGAAAVLLSVCVAVTVHTLGTARTLRTLRAADAQRFTSETSRLVSASAVEAQRFTAETARIKGAASAETARLVAESRAENERIVAAAAAEQARLQVSVDRLAARATRAETERSAAVAACANAAGRMQALSTSMLADLREMEHRHSDESVLGDLLHLDHRTAQAGRLADSIAVLTGARSGRRWAKPIVMESILRGAMGRIGSYQRVRLHSTSDVAIAGHAAEGVMHALAELLDNAANFSPPTAEVHVYVEEVPAGIVITVEDSGLVMSEVQLRRAERAVSADHQDLTNLSGTRLGLAVVGRLARKHGLTVSFRPSARGGTGALMMLPQELISRAVAPAPAATTTPTAPATSPVATAPAPADTAPTVELPAEPEPSHASAAGTDAAADAGRLPRTRTEDDASTPLTPAAEADSPGSPVSSADSVSESTGSVPEFGESGLPKRRRGRTLAAAEARTGNAAPGGADTPRARTTDPKVQAARFSTFSKAVRANSPHPEGNTR